MLSDPCNAGTAAVHRPHNIRSLVAGMEKMGVRDTGNSNGNTLHHDEDLKFKKKGMISKRICQVVVAALIGILILVLVIMSVYITKYKVTVEEMRRLQRLQSPTDDRERPWATGDQERSQLLYGGIAPEEYEGIKKFLFDDPELNLIPSAEANISSNYIYSIDDWLPPKSESLDYLNGGTQPVRKAKVTLFMGETKTIKELIVWPIADPKHKTDFVYASGKVPTWQSRPVCNVVEYGALAIFLSTEMTPLRNFMKEQYGEWMGRDCDDKCAMFVPVPRVVPGSTDRTVYIFFVDAPADLIDYYIYPVDLTLVLTTPGNGNEYVTRAAYVEDKKFDSVQAIADAYDNNEFTRKRNPDDPKQFAGRYGSPERRETPEFNRLGVPPPSMRSDGGRRFNVDGHHVKWLGYEFDYHFRTIAAAHLLNVKYNNERIAYEIGLQDIMVIYTGEPPTGSYRSYMDVGWSIGSRTSPLLPGYDCPHDAIYIDGSVYEVGQDRPIALKNAACVFEYTNSIPLRRHYSTGFSNDGGYRFLFTMPDAVLVFRQILTVWNYDYMLDVEFHQNGVIQTKVTSTGYIQVVNSIPGQSKKYGYDLNPTLGIIGALHTHFFVFKADMDIVSANNRFKTIDLGYETLNHTVDSSQTITQYTAEESMKTTEKEAIIKYDFSSPKHYVVYNEQQKNSFNQLTRGYRISGEGFAHIILPDDEPMLNCASWTKHQVSVTRAKDEERDTLSYFSQGDPYTPLVSMSDFQDDDESIVDEDLVAWVTLGLHHLPTAEDVPVTTGTAKTLTMTLSPFNYFPEDPSMSSRDASVRIP